MKHTRVFDFFSLKKVFFIKILFAFIFLVFFVQPTFAADWRESLGVVEKVDIIGGSAVGDVDADLYKLGEDFYGIKRFHDPADAVTTLGGWNNFSGGNRTGEEGVTKFDEDAFQYYTEVHGADGSVVRLLYNMGQRGTVQDVLNSQLDDKLVGFTVMKDGVYSEFYAQRLSTNTGMGGKELDDKWGDAEDSALINGYWVGTPEHDAMVSQIERATGIKFKDRDGTDRTLAQKASMVNNWSQFRNDWNNNGLRNTVNNIFSNQADIDAVYDALIRKAEGLPLKPGQQEKLDKLVAQSNGSVVVTEDGKVMTKTNASLNSVNNSDAAKAAAAKYRNSADAGSTPDNGGQCFYGTFSIDIDNCIEQMLFYILGIFAFLLGLAAGLFGMVFNYTVIGMSSVINDINSIGVVWKILRDFTNILFIFILLYLAISTILGLNEHGVKHTLSKLIMVAILINFSMFFAKAVVDASNILAISFYQKVNPAGKENDFKGANLAQADVLTPDSGIAGVFMNSLNMQRIYAPGGTDQAQKFAMSPNTGTIFIMGSITMFIVTCIFLAATVIFIRRLSVIIILIMTSSLAFAGSLLHKTEGMAHQWWDRLLREAFYAPIFMAVIWMALLVISDPGFLKSADKSSNFFLDIPTVVNYIIVINFFLMALVVGEKMGATGASSAIKGYQWLKANVGGRAISAAVLRPVGKWAYRYYEGKSVDGNDSGGHHAFKIRMEENLAGLHGEPARIKASIQKAMLGGLVNAKMGAGASQKEDFQERQHAMQEFMHEYKDQPAEQMKFLVAMNEKAKDLNIKIALQKTVEDMKTDELAELFAQLKSKIKEGGAEGKKAEEARDMFWGRLTKTQQDGVERKLEGALPIQREQYAALKKKLEDTKEYQEIYNAGGLNEQITLGEEKIKEMRLKNEPTHLIDIERRKLEALQKNRDAKEASLKNLPAGAALRQYFASLNTAQQAGLQADQITTSVHSDLLQGRLFTQLENSGKLTPDDYKRLGKVIDDQITRLRTYTDAQKGDKGNRSKLLEMVNEHLKGSGKEIKPKSNSDTDMKEATDLALDIYEKELFGGDMVTTSVSRNASRTFGTTLGQNGETYNKEAGAANAGGRSSALTGSW